MKSFQLKTGHKITPEIQTKAIDLIVKFIDKGIGRFDNIVDTVRQEYGKETLQKILPALKSSYVAYLTNASDVELKSMDSFDYVRSYKFVEIKSETGKNISKIQKSKTAIWKWEEAESLAKGLFCVWKYDEDFEWLNKNWYKFSWAYKNKTQLIELKIKLFALANIYYEFCHEAYGGCYAILGEDISADEFPYNHIQKLLKKYNITLEKRSPLYLKVFELIQKFKYPLFEELCYIYKSMDNIADELKSISPDVKADYAGEEYIIKWGDTYSNFW